MMDNRILSRHKTGILFIETGTSGGGSFESLYTHLCYLDRGRFEPYVVYLSDNSYVKKLIKMDITVDTLFDVIYSNKTPYLLRWPLARILRLLRKRQSALYLFFVNLIHLPLIIPLTRIVKKNGIRIIHLNDQVLRDFFGVLVARKTGAKCVSHLRSMREFESDPLKMCQANRVVSIYIANSGACLKHWISMGVDGDKARVVHNAIPRAPVSALNLRTEFDIKPEVECLIGCVANFYDAKGHDFLIPAFVAFLLNFPGATLLLVGHGDEQSRFMEMVNNLGISESVVFVGYDTRSKEIIAGLDLLVVPSKSEAFGRTLLEAMIVGTPIVATNVGGIKEVISNEYNGLLIEYGDTDAFVTAVQRLLTDDLLRQEIIANGFTTIAERFDARRYASEIESTYEAALDESDFTGSFDPSQSRESLRLTGLTG